MRKGNIEFEYSEINEAYELVRRQHNCDYVIAFFRKDNEGYYMETIGDRFFEDRDAWFVGKHAIKFLNDIFEEENGD